MARIAWPGLEGHSVDTETGKVYAPSGDFTGHVDAKYGGDRKPWSGLPGHTIDASGKVYAPSGDFTGYTDPNHSSGWSALEAQLNDTAANYQTSSNEAQGYTAKPSTGYDLQKDFYGPGKHALFDLSGKGPPPGMSSNVRYVSPKEAQELLARGELESKGENLKYAIKALASIAGGAYASGAFGGAEGLAAGTPYDFGAVEFGTGGAAAGGASGFAPDAIEHMIGKQLAAGGDMTWSEVAKQLGHGSVESYLGSVNPAWVSTAAGAINPLTGLPNEQAPAPVETRTPGGVGTTAGAAVAGAAASPLLKQLQDLGLIPSAGSNLLSGILGIGSGLYGLDQVNDLKNLGSNIVGTSPDALIGAGVSGANDLRALAAAEADKLRAASIKAAADADPWGVSGGREIASSQLRSLLQDPSSITERPGYQAGLEAVQRSLAAQGYQGSGNMMAALHKYGGDFYNNAVKQLSEISGATVNPAVAAQLGLSGQTSAAQIGTSGATNAAQLEQTARIASAQLGQQGRTDAAKINMAGQIASNDLASRSLASIGYGATRTIPALEAFTKGVFA